MDENNKKPIIEIKKEDSKKSTNFEIYRAFSNLMIDIDSLDEITKEKYIDAFIAL